MRDIGNGTRAARLRRGRIALEKRARGGMRIEDWGDGDLWVFGYGSLMWRPGFAYAERQPARVRGYHRALCVYSHVHRGTPDRPGLVLGLDRGGSCRGIAFRVAAHDAAETVAYLRAREQVTAVYLERRLEARLADGRDVRTLAYVVDRAHLQYAGRLDDAELLRLVRQGIGASGANPDYVVSTHAHLVEIGVRDPRLARLAAALAQTGGMASAEAIAASGAAQDGIEPLAEAVRAAGAVRSRG